ncbi:MAG: FHA domain-containing protein [Planctomycetes bacterium]|nr:FHA domain-containing protein [Planctomycetota bacterium]
MSDPRWVLELTGLDSRSVELPLSGTLVVGCANARAGFVIDGQGVDEAHCAIGRTKEGDWAVKDLGSRHGTLLNGQRVGSARLKLGDQLVLGTRRLEVRAARDAALAAVGSARPSDAPQKIGGYRIERLIGKGGMGAVYLAVQESLRRPVALKVLPPKLAADRDFVHRFQAEARAAAALSHPNVVVVYDVGEENGQHYLSMEFMAGGSLEQKLTASGPLPWKAVLSVLSDAAAGLSYAESRGIVHRDIKPANLMYSGTGTVKIADLGLATTLEQEASEAVDGRRVFGTPHFISPEQARGEAVDHRSDLYSLGATAYRLLSGKTPFEGASTREILRALQNDAPRPLKELVASVPPELDAVITRLMEKTPGARFATAESLRRECERLRLVAEHGPTLEVQSGSRSQRWLGLVLLLVVLGASAAWYALNRPAAPQETGTGSRVVEDAPAVEAGNDTFFGNGNPTAPAAPDEEGVLRAREREAEQRLREIPAGSVGDERVAALERVRAQYPGTAAAARAESEIAGLRAGTSGSSSGRSVDPLVSELKEALANLGPQATLAAELAVIENSRPPLDLVAAFEPLRLGLAAERVQAAEGALRARFASATELALAGRFAELRAHLAATEAAFAGLDEVPGDPARLAGMKALRDELATRRARVDEEERFYRATAERAERRAVGEALGPGSGLLAELGGLDLDAVARRLEALSPAQRARPLCVALQGEVAQAKLALDSLGKEFGAGGWSRKSVVDPRSKKVRDVRDVRPEGLVFEKEGALDSFSWKAAKNDPDWFNKLFQGRLARDWNAGEARGIVAVLRLIGATRGAAIARELLDARARGLLQPADLTALAEVFAPAQTWLEGAAPELRAALQRESASAVRLAQALEAYQAKSLTGATAHLERLLAEGGDSLLVGLLSDGGDWMPAPSMPPVQPTPANGDSPLGK